MVIRELLNKIGFTVDDKSLKASEQKYAKLKASIKKIGVIAGAAIVSIGTLALKTAADMEALNAQFEVLTGSAEKANKLTEQLVDFASKTPFKLQDLSEGTKTLLNFGVGADEALPILQNLGDIAGGSSEKLKTLALVFGQIKGLGKLQGQDWRQLINVGFNPLQVMAEKTVKSMLKLQNKTVDQIEFNKLLQIEMGKLQESMSKGTITFDMFADTLKDVTSEGGMFYQNMLKASQTVKGVFSTLQDAFTLSLAGAANKALPQIKEAMLQLIPILQNEFKALVSGIVGSIIPIMNAVIKLLQPVLNLLIPILKILSNVLNFLSKILESSILPFINSLVNMMIPLFNDLSAILTDLFTTLEPLLNFLLNMVIMNLKRYLYPLLIQLKILFAFLRPLFKLLSIVLNPFLQVLNKIAELINKLIDRFYLFCYDIIDKGVNFVKEKLSGLGDGLKTVFQGVQDFFYNIINAVIDGINWLIEKTNKIAKTKIELIDKLDPAKMLKANVTNNNQRQTNNNINNKINVNGVSDTTAVKNAVDQAAGTIFNLELKKLLMESGGL